MSEQLRQYFNHDFDDSADDKKMMSAEEKQALSVFEDTVKFKNGHYHLAIPWKNFRLCLPNNRSIAEHRLTYQKRKLSRNPDLHSKYKAFIDDLKVRGYAQTAPKSQHKGSNGKVWYLPHHNVVNPKKPEKTRVVFDCAAKYHGTSLNENVLQGPDLTNSLVGVLTRFRQETVALIADIEAMFHQVRVDSRDVDALRFLWFHNGDLTQEPEELQMMVHLFGGVWSPSCSAFALKRTADDNKLKFDSDVINTVKHNFYVDDLLKSVKSCEEATRMYGKLKELMSLGGFNLTKWISNKREVIDAIPESELSKELKNIDYQKDTLPVERALGVHWNVETDKFQYNVCIREKPATRRGILSVISSIYDPLGMAAPFILNAKLIMQRLCRERIRWDEEIPEKEVKNWRKWLDELETLKEFKVDRCFKPETFGDVVRTELHNFADASEAGFGAVSFLRSINNRGEIHCSFVLGKARLSPMKPMTIPRLELSAATVAVRLDRLIKRELEIHIDKSVFWTDSTSVLKYINNRNKRFQTFVANRIAIIHDNSDPSQWNYVETKMNPADDASRGLSATDLISESRWITGPDFLWQSDDHLLIPEKPTIEIKEDDIELKKSVHSHSVMAKIENCMIEFVFSKFSSWHKLKRAVAWILRFKNWLLMRTRRCEESPVSVPTGSITVKEIRHAERAIISCVQEEYYSDEINVLKSSKLAVARQSSLRALDPILIDDILCVGGRLRHLPAEMNDSKYPAIPPKNHHIVDMIVRHYHHLSGHSGKEHVLVLIRERYWIIQARVAVRKVLSRCFDCKRRQQQPMLQKMADLPQDRITAGEPPFTFVGVDYFGPFLVKRGRSRVKRYGIIFTCLTIRAVHIKVAQCLDTDSFINALRRFISRRGQPKEIRSDNGTSLTSGERELKQYIRQWNQSRILEFLPQQEIDWIFNPPLASHMGGVWERMIRSIPKVMNALMKEQILDDESLNTLMCEIESILNSRPLTKGIR